jgi:hypothetical protein
MPVVSVDAREVQANLSAFASARLPGITAQALTKAAWKARDALVGSMQSVFDRPTPFTLRSPIVVPAERSLDRPFAVVGFREWAPKGVPAGRYLQPQVFGGQRPQKGFERALALRPSRHAVPGKWAELDAYGNMNPGQLRKIMSFLRLGTSTTSAAQNRSNRRSKGSRRAEDYFIVPVGRTDSLLPPGIYRRSSEVRRRAAAGGRLLAGGGASRASVLGGGEDGRRPVAASRLLEAFGEWRRRSRGADRIEAAGRSPGVSRSPSGAPTARVRTRSARVCV